MANGIPARLSVAEGRRFGFTVGGAFLALALLLWWRGRDVAAVVLAGLGVLFVLGALVAATRMGPVQRAWMALALAISKVTTPIILGIVYYGLFTPMGVVRRAFGANSLVREPRDGSYWIDRSAAGRTRSQLTRQF